MDSGFAVITKPFVQQIQSYKIFHNVPCYKLFIYIYDKYKVRNWPDF